LNIMNTKQVTVPTLGLIAGTRMALGVGVGLLLAERLASEQRRAAGWALFSVGALTTIPLIAQVFGSNGRAGSSSAAQKMTAGMTAASAN
jgi:hypothetical protein